MQYTLAEEDYLKAIYKIAERQGTPVSTNAIAEQMQTRPASVTDMLKRLAEKELIEYRKYHGVHLTRAGARIATQLIRRHRLWECFLVDKLGYPWDEVHDLAEQLEHIRSDDLIDRLDDFLDRPKFDPHGDPIPDAAGAWRMRNRVLLSDLQAGQQAVLVGMREHDSTFLQYLDQHKLGIGSHLDILEIIPFDGAVRLSVDGRESVVVSGEAVRQLYVKTEGKVK